MSEVDETEARQRFAAARVARFATADESGEPHLVPVTFAVLGGELEEVCFAVDHKPKRSRDLRRLRNIEANPRVSLLVDHYDEDWTRLWWVRADGAATIHVDEPWRREPVAALAAKYPQYAETPPQGPVVRVAVTTWRGWAWT